MLRNSYPAGGQGQFRARRESKARGRFQSGLDSWCEETGGGGSGWSFGGAAMGLFLLVCHNEKSHPTVNQQ